MSLGSGVTYKASLVEHFGVIKGIVHVHPAIYITLDTVRL